jgi:hypothetical protein
VRSSCMTAPVPSPAGLPSRPCVRGVSGRVQIRARPVPHAETRRDKSHRRGSGIDSGRGLPDRHAALTAGLRRRRGLRAEAPPVGLGTGRTSLAGGKSRIPEGPPDRRLPVRAHRQAGLEGDDQIVGSHDAANWFCLFAGRAASRARLEVNAVARLNRRVRRGREAARPAPPSVRARLRMRRLPGRRGGAGEIGPAGRSRPRRASG